MIELPNPEKLTEIAAGILADATFTFVEATSLEAWQETRYLCARLQLDHGQRIELVLRAPPLLGSVLAANLLGSESDSEEAQAAAADALGELANMLAGALAVEIFGPDVICHIGIPTVATESGPIANAGGDAAISNTVLVTEEGHHLVITLRAGGGA